MDEKLYHRKNPRAQGVNYKEGLFFVTICTKEHRHYLGEIHDGKMTFSKVGDYLENELLHASSHHSHIEVLQYVVMPNHFHAIVQIDNSQEKNSSLSSYIGSLKAAITRYAHQCGVDFAWQGRFHDHAIRGVEDCNNISQYIENNVLNWEKDCFFGQM